MNRFTRVAVLAALAILPAAAAEDVPFITTPDNVTLAMLRMARVGAKDHVIDLGSGDGRIVITAARRFGASGLGVEIVPDLVRESNENARKAGVAARARFLEQDLFKTDLAPATVVTLYLLPEVNLQLRPAILALKPGTRVVSHDWDMGDWKPDRTEVVAVPDKKIGLEKSSRVHLWIVPARLEGAWCGLGQRRGATLALSRQFQVAEGAFAKDGAAPVAFEGRIEGDTLRTGRSAEGELSLKAVGNRLRVTLAKGRFAPWRGGTFERREGAACP